jgi:hypothetical protein
MSSPTSMKSPDGEFLFQVEEDGLYVGLRGVTAEPGYYVLPYAQLAAWAEHGPPDHCRWGLVLDGELHETHDSETRIRDRAAECRGTGSEVLVIRLPLDPV